LPTGSPAVLAAPTVLLPLLAGALLVYRYRTDLFPRSRDTGVRVVTAALLLSLGRQFARDVGRALGPTLFKRSSRRET